MDGVRVTSADRLGEVCGGNLLGVIPFDQDIALSFIGGVIERESTAGPIRHLVESGECCRLVSMNSQLPGFVAPAQLAPVLGSVAHRHPPAPELSGVTMEPLS